MNRFITFLRANAFTAGMLLFISAFYMISILGAHSLKSRYEPSLAPVPSNASLFQEFKEKEKVFEKKIAENPRILQAATLVLLFIFLIGLFLNVRFYLALRENKVWIGSSLSHESVRWDWTHVFSATIFMFFIEAILLIIEVLIYYWSGTPDIPQDFLLMANSLLRGALAALFIIFLIRRLGHRLSDLGLSMKDFFRNIGRGLVGYVAVLPVLFITLLVVVLVAKVLSYEPPPQNVVQIYLKDSSQSYLLFFTFFVAGIGPIMEEIFFRGFTYKAFRGRFGVIPAMILSSLIFAAFHVNLAAFLPIFILGMMLCYLYEKTGSLVPSMTAHVVHNLLMVSFTLGFKSLSIP